MESEVRTRRRLRTDVDRVDGTVVLLEISRPEESIAGTSTTSIRLCDSLPGIRPGEIAFPKWLTNDVQWALRDGQPMGTLSLEPGERLVTGYVVDAPPPQLQEAEVTVEVGDAPDNNTTVGSSLQGLLSRGTIAVILSVLVLSSAGGAILVGPEALTMLNGGDRGPDDNTAPTSTSTQAPTQTQTATATPQPTDSDDDGVADNKEREIGTDPNTADTDGDGLTDGRELLLSTDPTVADSDGDGLSDATEIELHTDPLSTDTDEDGITDAVEQSGPTDPRYQDTDDDGLSDDTERELGTDATDADTDGDGLPDGAELHSEQLSDADPLRHDVFVEIDYTRGERFGPAQRRELVELFRTAPTTNPDGSTGISLHLKMSDQVPPRENFEPADRREYRGKYMNNSCGGYTYAVLTSDPQLREEGDVAGFAGKTGLVSVGDPSVFLHELGHVKGLNPSIRGVDSRSTPMSVYPSVMNYNAPSGFLNYSTGQNGEYDHDDWAKVANTGIPGYGSGHDLLPYADGCSRTPG